MDQNSSERHLESKEELERKLAETRHSIAETVGEIRQELRAVTYWETYVQRYPLACLCGGGAVGLVVGRKLGSLRQNDTPRGQPRSSITVNDRSALEYASRYASAYPDEPSEPSKVSKMAESLAAVVFAEALALFAAKLKQFVARSPNTMREYGTHDVSSV